MGSNCLLLCCAKFGFRYHRSLWFLRSLASVSSTHKSQAKECYSFVDKSHCQRASPTVLEIPKGMKDYGPKQVRKKNLIIQKIVHRFQSHGAESVDTPVFELWHILTGKFGNGCKLIYLADDGGMLLAMRYDLTVPFARYIGMNKIKSFKRYQIGKVYRQKCPNVNSSSAMKEFTQCDYDIVGQYDVMLPDVECIQLIKEVFEDLEIQDYVIKVNHRQLLYGILEICGVPFEKFNSICSSIHKSDKLSWDELRAEMINIHNLTAAVTDRIGEYIMKKGGKELIKEFLLDEKIAQNKLASQALQEMQLFFTYCKWLDIDKVSFDLSLAGSFDYYTGIVFKGILKGISHPVNTESTLWVAGGGRYDKLVGMFHSVNYSIPCVGVSFMVENLLAVLENGPEAWNLSTESTCNDVCVDQQAIKQDLKSQIDESTENKEFRLTVPKGTKDFTPFQMKIREELFRKIISCFEKHGFEPMDTPLFEVKEYLYRDQEECNKLIFDVEAKDSKPVSMRYDLTVPFARYFAMNQLKHMKRYQIGHVGRRDNPSLSKGRLRSFYQCDIDIAGDYGPMIADVECINILMEIMRDIEIEEYIIKVNHRKILDGILDICCVPPEKRQPVFSAIDKLDKCSWDEIREEMIHERGLDATIADHIGKYIQKKGSKELVQELSEMEDLSQNESIKQGLQDMKLLLSFFDESAHHSKVIMDLSLARGLEYYTGVIFEAVLKDLVDSEGEQLNIGSIAGGGRYDNLIGAFSMENENVPCVGMSLGIERIFVILETKAKASGKKIRTSDTEILVTTPQKQHAEQRTRMCSDLWKCGIKTELQYKLKPRLLDQLQYCENRGIPWAVIIGQEELDSGIFKLRNIETREEFGIPQRQLIEEIKNRCNIKPR